MAKGRVKKRTHIGAPGRQTAPGNAPSKPGERTPKSMVIRIGASEVGPSVTQLVRDVRTMMEPQTATRLRERRSNKLRDYTTMAGPLGVSHLLLFSKSSSGNTNMRLALTPRGPTFHFRVEKYSLCKDVQKGMRRPKIGANDNHLTPPLLVMNHFTTQLKEGVNGEPQPPQIPKHLESLTTTVFQSLFPPINPTTTPLKGIKRVLLLDRKPADPTSDSASYIVDLRHFAIETRTAKSVPKALRKLDAAEKLKHPGGQKRKRGALPNLGKLDDVADYLLDPHAADGFTSGSDSEPDTDAEVEVLAPTAQRVQRRNTKKSSDEAARSSSDRRDPRVNVEKKGIKLHELGPRLRLRLTKVEEGVCAGKVMWHEYIHKTKEELKRMDRVHEVRRQEKEARKKEQRANVERKRAERRARGEPEVDEEEEGEGVGLSDAEDDEWDDEEGVAREEDGEEGEDEDDAMEDDVAAPTSVLPALAVCTVVYLYIHTRHGAPESTDKSVAAYIRRHVSPYKGTVATNTAWTGLDMMFYVPR
ncbi:rRNA-binding ribosome biosynthesis protein [Friedmanniomyces endolithicus]|nr:rRNA-binding ribosome biosynthesis protein [Friedmanniomyces endolithicus]